MEEFTQKYEIFNKNIMEASVITETTKATAVGAIGGASGAIIRGWWGAIPWKQTSSNIISKSATVGGLVGVYYAVFCVVSQARQKDDALNAAAGGMIAGLCKGLSVKSTRHMAAYAVGVGLLMGVSDALRRELQQGAIYHPENREALAKDCFKYPQKDIFTERFKEIKASE